MADTRTLGNMMDRIADEFKTDDLLGAPGSNGVASIYNAIRDAIFYYQLDHFFSNETVDQTITTQTGVNLYTAPADFLTMTQLDIIGNGIVYPLVIKTYQVLDSWDAISNAPTQGFPNYYAWYSGQVRLFPTPDKSNTVLLPLDPDTYTLRFIYQNKIAEPTATTDTNFWTTTAEEIIRNRAKYLLDLGVFRDQAAAQLDKQLEMEALQRLMQRTAQQLFTGTLVPTQF